MSDDFQARNNQMQAIKYENVALHKETCIRPSYKDVKIPSPILGHVT